jgi:hypothetical protein
MRNKKRKQKINFPNGYPYVLYKVSKGKESKYTLAVTEDQALRDSAIAKARVVPVSVSNEIARAGHSKINKLFSQFGPAWVCKENHVFFKNPNVEP